MASDLPDAWRTSTQMARALVSYIDCPHRVLRELKSYGWLKYPSVEQLRQMRADHLRGPRDCIGPWKPHDGYYPDDAAAQAEAASQLFLKRLDHERELSGIRRNLHLAAPDRVNRQWDREMAA